MSLFSVFNISGSAMNAETIRLALRAIARMVLPGGGRRQVLAASGRCDGRIARCSLSFL